MSISSVMSPLEEASKCNVEEDNAPVVLVYHCWLCVEMFFDKLGILRHLQDTHKDRPELEGIEKKMKVPICMECGAVGTCEHRKENANAATKYTQFDEEDDDGDKVSKPRFLYCLTCLKQFTLPESLYKHRLEDHPSDKPFQCPFCSNLFADRSHLVVHKRIHTGSRPYICTLCGNRFPKSSDLKRHALIHTGNKPFQCARCDKTFTQRSSLEKHAKIHAKQTGGFPCLLCGLVFMEVSELNDHTHSTHGDVNYKCKICGKLYMEERHLLQHEKNHFLVKPYPCSYCDRRFSFRPLLVKHEEKIHQAKKDIACDICGKIFKRTENLNRHKLSHTGARNHKCDQCGLAFTEKGSLTRHIKSQHDQLRPHTCYICGRAFTRKILVRKHVERCHEKGRAERDVKDPTGYFKCKLCNKLLRKSGMRHHIKLHKVKGDNWEEACEGAKLGKAGETSGEVKGEIKEDDEEDEYGEETGEEEDESSEEEEGVELFEEDVKSEQLSCEEIV